MAKTKGLVLQLSCREGQTKKDKREEKGKLSIQSGSGPRKVAEPTEPPGIKQVCTIGQESQVEKPVILLQV